MKPTPGRPSNLGAAIGALLLVVVGGGSAWGLWRLLDAALDLTRTAAWLPAVILALLAAHWTIAASGRARERRRGSAIVQARKAAAYRRALTDRDAWAEMVLWASVEVLRQYSDYRRVRAGDPAAPFPLALLAGMRHDLGLRREEPLEPDVMALVLQPPLAKPPATRAASPSGSHVTRPTFFSP